MTPESIKAAIAAADAVLRTHKMPIGAAEFPDLRRDMFAAAVEAAEGAGWQPIETAPRDGTRILATGGGLGGEVDAVKYNDHVGCWDSAEYTLDDRDDESDGYCRPTRWRRIPTPPAEQGGQTG